MIIRSDLNWYKVYSQIVKNIGKPCVYIEFCSSQYKEELKIRLFNENKIELIKKGIGFGNVNCFIKNEEEFEEFKISLILSEDVVILECDNIEECEKIYDLIDRKIFYAAVFDEKGKDILAHN